MVAVDPNNSTPQADIRRAVDLPAIGRADGSTANVNGATEKAAPKRDTASELLYQLGDQALEFPPKNITVLAASVQKFLLTNLEPALRIAQEIREQASDAAAQAVNELANDDRREQAFMLLSPDSPTPTPSTQN